MENDVKSYVHVGLVLDASGSMHSIREETVKSLIDFFKGLRSAEDRTLVDIWQFNTRTNHLLKSVDLNASELDDFKNYSPNGCTALWDAICIGIDNLGKQFAKMAEADRPDSVIFAIVTDGWENASRKFSVEDVKQRIEHQKTVYNWEFRFLGANQDAVLTGKEFGLKREECIDFDATPTGMQMMCCERSALSLKMKDVRKEARMKRAKRLESFLDEQDA